MVKMPIYLLQQRAYKTKRKTRTDFYALNSFFFFINSLFPSGKGEFIFYIHVHHILLNY